MLNFKLYFCITKYSPGPVATNFGTKPVDEAAAAAKMERLKKITVLDRVATAEDIANLASFLVSDDAVNITGSLMVSDGGMFIK